MKRLISQIDFLTRVSKWLFKVDGGSRERESVGVYVCVCVCVCVRERERARENAASRVV